VAFERNTFQLLTAQLKGQPRWVARAEKKGLSLTSL